MEKLLPIKQLTIIGVGLIGGSFALELKRAQLVHTIIGVDRLDSDLLRAQQLGIIDTFMPLEAAVEQAELILVAVPVGQMAAIFARLAKAAKPNAIITDVGSTKADIAALYQQYLAARLAYCLPAHPIAGAEQSGVTAARYGLYQHRKVVLCPFAQTTESTLKTVQLLWQACGAQLSFLDIHTHDQILASISHLPHLVAFSYMHLLGAKPDINTCLDLASTGFRDFSRIAGSSPEMWRDIMLANRNVLLKEIQAYQQVLETLYQVLDQQDEQALFNFIEKASLTRQAWERKQAH
jgi:prephenate dehydrogenase